MPSDWQDCALGDAITLKRGYDLPAKERRTGTVPIVSSSGFSDLHAESMVKGPGVVTGRYGTIGQVFYVDRDFWPLNTTLYVQDFKGNDRRFVSYMLRMVDFHQFSDKAAVPGVNRNHLHTARIVLPPIPEQIRIASLLQSFDDRIDLLRQTNATLESIAQALFKSWFIDFDPVRAKAEGREPEGMDAATAALFPDEFEQSALGLIPNGWRSGTLTDVADLNARSWTAKRAPSEIAYVDLAGVKSNVFDAIQRFTFGDAPSRARRELKAGDTLVGTVRPGNRSFGFISEAEAGLTGSTGFAVLSPREPEAATFTYLCATRDENIERLAAVADGGAYPAVRPEIVVATPCVLPSRTVLAKFASITEPLMQTIGANAVRAQTLADTRDTLLPRLISGKLRLPEAQEQLEDALA